MKYLFIKNINKFALVDDEDYDRLSAYAWYANSTRTAIQTTINHSVTDKEMLLMGNVVIQRHDCTVDHKDRNYLNNQKFNLRPCTYQQNCFNKAPYKFVKSSKYKGVSKVGLGRWRAYIKINKKQIFLGVFPTSVEAALAYNKAATKLFKEFACLNVIDQAAQQVEQIQQQTQQKGSGQ